ncbi:hypothetical protein EOD39_7259 [Acipenser ruthenus]|uniref:Uncharacterized protein n=1 Tax=Acipenser ruthenus TaxID=7906 RepID=A0A444U7I8_ACIRT|nr:hypothetical protein EOD39_7259 [Acipenser ruthenus]
MLLLHQVCLTSPRVLEEVVNRAVAIEAVLQDETPLPRQPLHQPTVRQVTVRVEGVPCTALVATGSRGRSSLSQRLALMQGRGTMVIQVGIWTGNHPLWVAAVQEHCILNQPARA